MAKRTASAAASSSPAPSSSTPSKAATPAAPSQPTPKSTGARTRAEARKELGDVWNPPADSTDTIDVIINAVKRYRTETPHRMLVIDVFLVFLMALGLVQFMYCIIAGNYPFNAFLSGFGATVGQFVLTASLRMQTNPANTKGNFEAISDERAFADFVLGSLILHLFCVNFIN